MSTVAPELNWLASDLEIFNIDGFAERMAEIRAIIQPKLRALGERWREPLAHISGRASFPHVAKHMRRTVNPPPETWVAFGPSNRGYKQYPHFAFVVSNGGVHVRLIVKSEVENRAQLADQIRKQTKSLVKASKALPLRNYANWNYHDLPDMIAPKESEWQSIAERLTLKSGGLDIGVGFVNPTKLTEAELLQTFEQLAPIYQVLAK